MKPEHVDDKLFVSLLSYIFSVCFSVVTLLLISHKSYENVVVTGVFSTTFFFFAIYFMLGWIFGG